MMLLERMKKNLKRMSSPVRLVQASQLLTDGSQYEGEMLSGLPNGHGNKSFANGDDYEGQFKRTEGTWTWDTPI